MIAFYGAAPAGAAPIKCGQQTKLRLMNKLWGTTVLVAYLSQQQQAVEHDRKTLIKWSPSATAVANSANFAFNFESDSAEKDG